MNRPRLSMLLRIADQQMHARYVEQAGGDALTIPQLAVLRALRDHGTLNQTMIGQKAKVDRTSVSGVLKRLCWRFLVTSDIAPDSRANLVTITTAGLKALAKADSALVQGERIVMARVPVAARKAFLEALEAIAAGAR